MSTNEATQLARATATTPAPVPGQADAFAVHVTRARELIASPAPTHIPHVLEEIVSALELASAERAAK